MSTPVEILVVDDEEHIRHAASQTFDLAGYRVRTLSSAEDALPLISRTWSGVLVSDIRMPGMDGIELLHKVMAIDSDLPVLLTTGHGDVKLAVSAMRDGAYDFIEKPFTNERLLDSVSRAIEKRILTLENRSLRESVAHLPDDLDMRLVGRSAAMCEVRKQVRTVAATPADVLILGETGTGKEVAARAIHDLSAGKDRPFVAINCAALSNETIETELFGYEVGAFPGAIRPRFGKLEHGRHGTIFLDEIDSMPLDLQAVLLRVIEERAVTRLGSHEAIPLEARFIATANSNIEAATRAGQVRKDLYYRLNVACLTLPTLDERRDDIPFLFANFVQAAALRLRLPASPTDDALYSALVARPWPGNVRELRNTAERYVLGLGDSIAPDEDATGTQLKDRVAAFEAQAIATELKLHNGNLKAVYEALGLSRKTLYEKMQKYGFDRQQFRGDDA